MTDQVPAMPSATSPPRSRDAVRWLGHATCVIDVAGIRLVTDPLLGPRAGVLIRRGRVPERHEWEGADAVLLSHLHHDHAHIPSLRAVGGEVHGASSTARWALRQGLRANERENGWITLGAAAAAGSGVEIRTVPAVHGDRPMPHRPNDAVGFVVRWRDDDGEARRLWFAGDTELFPELERIPDLAGGPIDVALVPVGGWGPRLSGGHLDPVRAVQACELVGARVAVPIHWGTFHAPLGKHLPRGWMDRGGPEFLEALAEQGSPTRGVLLTPGQVHPLQPASGE